MLRANEILKWVQGPDVLDVGCTGHKVEFESPYWIHAFLRDKFPGVYGIDISAENVKLLQEHGYDHVYVQSAESFDLPQTFDTIVAGELIEHLANPGEFLVRAKAHLKANGRVVLTTPYLFALVYVLYSTFAYPSTCRNPEHTCWFCPDTMHSLAERCGFRVEQYKLIEGYRDDSPYRSYRIFVRVMHLFRWLIPDRLRCDTMLYVLAPAEETA